MKMKHFTPLDCAWLTAVTVLRMSFISFSIPREVVTELLYLIVGWGIGAGVDILVNRSFPQRSFDFDTTGSLVPLALTASAVVLAILVEQRSLLFPVGVLFLAIPLGFTEDHPNGILTNILATAVLVTRVLPAKYQAEYLLCACIFFFLASYRHVTEGYAFVRFSAATLILGSYALLRWYCEGFPTFQFLGNPLQLILQGVGYTLLFFLPRTSGIKFALRLLALTLPDLNGFTFWSLVSLGMNRGEEEQCYEEGDFTYHRGNQP